MTPERHRQIGDIYRAALELEPAERAAYLAEACGGDEALRQDVESLLEYDARSAGLIDQSALEVVARSLAGEKARSLVGQNVGHCRILALLGTGGMGEVWLAEDARLGRKVAIKLLPAEFAADAGRMRRFAQEARAASALNHPNIITIHEIGEASTESGGMRYITTELVEGETLRQRMAETPQQRMNASEALGVATQIAAALSVAHAAGIVHRDIKPENVMLRRDGLVKVLDFGLASMSEPSTPGIEVEASGAIGVSTEPGVVVGTPRYMSPEQARGEKADARTDIFSLGVLLYEMITGRPPFAGATPGETTAAILRDEPPPLAQCAPDAPPELGRIVDRALRKDRAERYQNAGDLLTDLSELKKRIELRAKPGKAAFRSAPAGGIQRVLRKRWALFAAAALLVAVAGAWYHFTRPPPLTEKDTILLADFENRTGDAAFDRTLKYGLAIQLEQSPFVHLFPEARVRHELRLMRRPPDERVTTEIAREICVRQNLKAFIAGAIAPLGNHYVITLEAINTRSGEVLARQLVEVESREQVLRALSQAATQLREKLGESLSSIRRFDKPLVEATTSRLEALEAWSAGIEQSYRGPIAAIPFYKRAIELDPEFAHAYSLLSVLHWATGLEGPAAEYAEKGYALRDKVSEYEKLRITSFYHGFATGNLNQRIEVLMLQKQMYPRDASASNDLANSYIRLGRSDQAIGEARESLGLNPSFAAAYRNQALALLRLNRFSEAGAVLAQAIELKLDLTEFHSILYQIAFIHGDSAAQQQIEWARGKPDEHVALEWQAGAAAVAGHWRRSRDFSRRAIDLAARGDTKEVAARYAAEQALRSAVFGGCRQAESEAADGLKLARGRAALPRAALALAQCGGTSQVKSLIGELARRYPEDTLINEIWLPAIRAAGELNRGNAERALEHLQAAFRYEAAAEFWPQHLRGQAHLRLGQGAEAAAEFHKILDHRGQAPLSVLYPLAHLGLARAEALTGAAARSRTAWEEFFASWKTAEPGLPVLSEAKREYEKKPPPRH